MSWLQKLYETYETSATHPRVGTPLLPVSHTLQQAHIEIIIDDRGHFKRATVLEGVETVVPATESSSGRTNRPAPHGLCDKLQYVAKDCPRPDGPWQCCYNLYMDQLQTWCSENPHAKAQAVLEYVKKGSVVADLIAAGVLHRDAKGRLLDRWHDDGKPPDIFKALPKKTQRGTTVQDQTSAFVRWRIETPGDPLSGSWEDMGLIRSWMEFDTARQSRKGFCMITGEAERALATNHPARLRHGGDRAKLISANDEDGYTFRGRFGTADQAASISLDATQKAHSALRWLINRQGYRNGAQVIISWAVSGKAIPDPLADSGALFGDTDDPATGGGSVAVPPVAGDVGQAFAKRLSRLITGYKAELGPSEQIVVMGVDSATPGRMAVTFYRELTGSEFLIRLMDWHDIHAWPQDFSKSLKFVGAPAPRDIASAAFGRRMDDKLSKATVERLLPCIIDGRQVPRDLMVAVSRRASNRVGMEWWEWEKTLGIACSLFRGFHKERKYSMALETGRTTRDYLYGRLLAIAERIEGRALYMAGESRDTTAGRLMQRFSDHPFSTWLTIEKSIPPYKSRLQAKDPAFLAWITGLLDEVHGLFRPEDYMDDRPLSGEYLLGYHCQRRVLHERPQKPEDNNE